MAGRLVSVFGESKLLKRNPWRRYKPDAAEYYLATPPDWTGDASKLRPAQVAAAKAFAHTAKRSIEMFPADGSFKTLWERVKWIGNELRGKGKHGGVYTVPISATAKHPLKALPAKAQEVYTPRNYFGV